MTMMMMTLMIVEVVVVLVVLPARVKERQQGLVFSPFPSVSTQLFKLHRFTIIKPRAAPVAEERQTRTLEIFKISGSSSCDAPLRARNILIKQTMYPNKVPTSAKIPHKECSLQYLNPGSCTAQNSSRRVACCTVEELVKM